MPACLAQLPPEALCDALKRPPQSPENSEAWIPILAAAAARTRLRDLDHGVALVEELSSQPLDPAQRPWRDLGPEQLMALVGERASR